MPPELTCASLRLDLESLGVCPGDILMVHSSFRAISARDPELILRALTDAIGSGGTLLLPALTYMQEPPDVHDTRLTPTCVGFLTEHFRTRPGTRRSLHPTHSVCGIGARADELLADHGNDTTPCGPCSPFRRLIEEHGKVLMLGCGLRPNTTMHAVEEYARPPYLFGPTRVYTITDGDGRVFRKEYTRHGFAGFTQRYDRMDALLSEPDLATGSVGHAQAHLIAADALRRVGCERMAQDPYAFVEPSA